MNPNLLSLYFVAGSQDCRHLPGDPSDNLLTILQQALQAGISCFQFRDKGEGSLADNPIQQAALARQCQALCRQYQVPFLVNDDVALAVALQADGVHVGQADMSVEQIKAKTNRSMLIGVSINQLSEALAQDKIDAIDYFGVGPIFPTQSKADAKAAVGVDFVQQLRQAGIRKPIVAIGGIDSHCSQILRQQGADGVAVISAITRAENIDAKVKELLA